MEKTDENDEVRLSTAIKALDDALAEGPWGASNFLRLISVRLQEIRADLAEASVSPEMVSVQATEANKNAQQQLLYVSLYAAEGSKLPNWERILSNLPKQVVSRPIYAEEVHAQDLIKSKTNQINEAYAVVSIDPDNILVLSSDKTTADKLGNPLISLKDNAITLDNIKRFVHASGRYRYAKGRLLIE